MHLTCNEKDLKYKNNVERKNVIKQIVKANNISFHSILENSLTVYKLFQSFSFDTRV